MRSGSIRVAEVSLPAIRHNVRHIRQLTGGTVIAVIKANGYGHGSEIAARAAIEGGATLLGVTDLEEALALRDLGIDAPILCWLNGVRADFDAAVRGGIEIGVSHVPQLEAVAAAATRVGRRATVQFKIDTGLSRNGAAPAEWDALFARGVELERAGQIRIRGIFSHLANAGDDNDRAQAARFDQGVQQLRDAGCDPELVHLAASAATFSSPHLHYNTVRVGVTIYGLSPFADRTSADLGLIPAMTLKSEIVGVRQVPAGTGVSYGYNHVVQTDTTLALVPVGYADGMPRALNGAGATVAIAGVHCPIVGRIGMDQCIVDLGSLAKKVGVGEPVVLFGDPATGVPPVELWAELMRTINYEIIVGIGSRVLRVPVEDAPGELGGADAAEADGSAGSTGFAGSALHQQERIDSPEAMHDLGVRLGRQLRAGDLVVLTGPLGAGKTTLTRGIGEGLGVRGPVTSPTFVLARTHPSLTGGAPLVHVDAYRLGGADELDDLDLDYDGSVVVVEWGAGLLDNLENWVEIVIERPVGGDADLARAAVAGDGASGRGGAPAEGGAPARGGAPAHGAGIPFDGAESIGLPDDATPTGGTDEWVEEPVEARTITIIGHGPRWSGGVI